MPTNGKVKKTLLTLLPETKGKIYELGSGWGNLVFDISKQLPKAEVYGVELSPAPFLYSTLLRFIMRSKVKIQVKNFFNINLSTADGVVCYLYPGAMKRLKGKFEKELRQGSWVISHTFEIPGWQAAKTLVADDLYRTKIYLYIKNED